MRKRKDNVEVMSSEIFGFEFSRDGIQVKMLLGLGLA
jgi:hypothetical protein